MPRIGDLSASQLARLADNIMMFQGRRKAGGGRLAYHALVLNHYEGTALRCLYDFIVYKETHDISAAVLEYALTPGTPISEFERKLLDEIRFRSLWQDGFSRHDSGRTTLDWDDFQDRSRFQIDERAYREFLEPTLAQGGSLEGAFRAAHTLAGALSGLLIHSLYGTRPPPTEEAFHPDRFFRAPAYDQWLWEDTAPLDALEGVRQERYRPRAKHILAGKSRAAPPRMPQVTQNPNAFGRCRACGAVSPKANRQCSRCHAAI